jgi:exonuclease SbcC
VTPTRVKLSGFLSYADEQELSFDGAGLWLLAGPNGSGKSAVFDAITYSLFGEHRGGKTNAVELVHKEKNSFAVEFDFALAGRTYRIKRTLRKGKTGAPAVTQQVFVRTGDDWAAVPDTTKKLDFDKWVHDHIGLTYETFTSSVLLLQGKAEKLLDSKPAGRAEVLAGIVDLEKYQKLHERAVERRKHFEGKVEEVVELMGGVGVVSDEQLAAAVSGIDAAEAALAASRETVTRFAEAEVQARRWQDAAARHAKAEHEVKTAEALLAEAAKIEKEYARVVELRTVLPAIHLITAERAKVGDADRRTERYLKDRDRETERQRTAERAAGVAKGTRDKLKVDLADHERKHATASVELRTLTAQLEKARTVEKVDAELARLDDEAKAFPPDPAATTAAAQHEVDRLTDLARIVPILSRFHSERAEHAAAVARRDSETKTTNDVKAAGERAKAELEGIQTKLKVATAARAAAEKAATEAAVLLAQAKAAAVEFESQLGGPSCRACGQPLTPAHVREEKTKRAAEVKTAEAKYGAAEQARSKAAATETESTKAEADGRQALDELRGKYKDHAAAAKHAGEAAERHDNFCRAARDELPDEYRDRTEADSITLGKEVVKLDGAKRHLAATRTTLEKWQAHTATVAAKKATRATLAADLPGDLAAVREHHATVHATEASLVQAIKAAKRGIEDAEREADTHARDTQSAAVALAEITGKLNQEDALRTQSRAAIERAAKNLPLDWQLRVEHAGLQDSFVLQGELDAAGAAGVEEKYKRLDLARGRRQVLKQQAADLAAEADTFPPEHRLPPDEVRIELAAARRDLDKAGETVAATKQAKAGLDAQIARLADLAAHKKQLTAEANYFKRLAELLGRDRLQRHLVRTAERQIVDHANAVLDRLSGGQLRLVAAESPDGGTAEKALDLDAVHRPAGGSPIPVAFLSGSQKFRVAVALALGIGRYASRQHRPIESVILDEGFGCLDRTGRQTMIQELQALRGQLARVLVVSHQEEFQDAFANGYTFDLVDGRTRVERFG